MTSPSEQLSGLKLDDIQHLDEPTFRALIFNQGTMEKKGEEGQFDGIFKFECVANLANSSESDLQSILSREAGSARAIDTHATRNDMIEFMLPRDFLSGSIFSNTGKCDLTSLSRRMVFEVKPPKQKEALILQIIQRVTSSLDISHILSNAIAFGLAGGKCYLCIGTRKIPNSRVDCNQKNIFLFELAVENIDKYWRIASNCEPEDFLTEDGVYLWHAISPKVNPFLCRIRLLDWSQSRVYELTFPETFENPTSNIAQVLVPPPPNGSDGRSGRSTTTCLGVRVEGDMVFTMKVVLQQDSFLQEAKANAAIQSDHYCGCFAFSPSHDCSLLLPSSSSSSSSDMMIIS